MTGLDAVLAEDGERLVRAARGIGARLAVDPTALLHRDQRLAPPGRWSPNHHCRLVRAADGWLAVNLPRPDDRDSVAAWLELAEAREPWRSVVCAARGRDLATLLERAALLQLAVAQVGEAEPQLPPLPDAGARRTGGQLHVVDLSTLWAGPLCGGLLAAAGMDVLRCDSVGRPDPVARTNPGLDVRVNGGKRRASIDWRDSDARARLLATLAQADVLITSARPLALARLGLTPEVLFAANPGLLWVAVTGHGWAQGQRIGFGDDCAAAGGLVAARRGGPVFVGDALADPLTGLAAAIAVFEALAAGRAGLIDAGLAPVAAAVAQRAGYR